MRGGLLAASSPWEIAMPNKNRLARVVHKFDAYPLGLRRFLITWAFGGTVHFVRTTGVKFQELTEERAVLILANRRRVQNHIGTVHAAAVALIGETATGAVFGMSVPDERIPLLKSMRINYTRRSQGAMRAEATLTPAMRERFWVEEKGEIAVPVRITDETGEPTVEAEYVWAWRPKKKP
jgi:acyl-coenzyme A thioesterase PaaI-like protein